MCSVTLDKQAQPNWVEALGAQADAYVRNLLGVSLCLEPAKGLAGLPHFLLDQFAFLGARLLDKPLRLMLQPPSPAPTPANIARLWREVQRRSDRAVVYVAPAMSAFNRKRLLEQRTPFLVPGNQMFLPCLGLDLRETFRSERQALASDQLTPAAQAVVLAAFYGFWEGETTASALAPRLSYSPTALGRVFNELVAAGLARFSEVGKERRLAFRHEGRTLWRKSANMLRSPVRKVRHLKRPQGRLPGLIAGETALASYTMLGEPRFTTVAVAAAEWPSLAHRFERGEAPAWDERRVDVETWTYDPKLFSDDGRVDRLSLHLAMREHEDERVVQAAQHLLEEMAW
ncbi:MAG: hypothetical protein BroJett013_24960 [Alphaproteobacteria bacterium]|nr:MAG: hypothetical protein BroJett013_24960 [Alphaproteobacteria bacterium]